ncbi:MAG: hypothetical protein NTW53_00095 [Burkholderiales bacterium]|nr:hypothetical protein [Burkholderiales bacterium]
MRPPGARSPGGVTAEDRAHLVYFDYNDLPSLQQVLESVRGDAAGLATLDVLERHDGVAHRRRMGERLRAGL